MSKDSEIKLSKAVTAYSEYKAKFFRTSSPYQINLVHIVIESYGE
jgi:hypothetical protein